MKRVAITGGIGSGKSLAVRFFNDLGIPSLDADAIARKLREPDQPAHAAILKRFGTDDRLKLREILSSDPQAKKDLESLLHPLIRDASEQELQKIETTSNAPFVLYEASLIIEAGRAQEFDALIVVTAPEPNRIERIIARDSIPESSAKAIIRTQLSDEDRLKHATHVLSNSGTPEQLKAAVIKLLDQLKQL